MAKAKKKTAKKGPRQARIPGASEPDIAELDDIAAELSEAHADQMAAKNRCTQLRGRMMSAMQKHDRTLYQYDGVRYEIVEGDPKLKLKLLREYDVEAAE